MLQYIKEDTIACADFSFTKAVKDSYGTHIERCYQCYTCSAGCPLVYAMDYLPHQIIRMVQLGLKEPVLSSSTIWICVACETCATRCPNEIEIVELMDILRQMSLKENVRHKEKNIILAHRCFLKEIKRWGRVHEISLIVSLKLKTREFFRDIGLGTKMFLKGKLKILPAKVKAKEQINKIFESIKLK